MGKSGEESGLVNMAIDRASILALVAEVNATDALDCTATLDYLGDTPPCATVQQLPGARWETRYIDGSGIHEQPFAVLYRTLGNDTSGRVDASAALYALADALEAKGAVSGLGSVIGADTPALVERGDNGVETWRITFMLKSQVQGR